MKFWVPYLCVPYRHRGHDLRGWNCWGAVRYILKHHANIEVPIHDTNSAEIIRLSKRKIWKEVAIPETFDVVCMKVPSKLGMSFMHVGIMVEPQRVLHCEEGLGTICVPINHSTLDGRIGKIVRHESMFANSL